MADSRIQFHKEDIKFRFLYKNQIISLILELIKKEGYKAENINYIFTSDNYLLSLNKQYLNHNTLTDIITFDNSAEPGVIESDIFISIERIKENAEKFNTTFVQELARVIIHGALHLTGYKDKKASDKDAMTNRENYYLNILKKKYNVPRG